MSANIPLTVFLCLSAALLTAGAVAENDHGCPEGWTPIGTRCFKFFDSKATWTLAEKSCQAHGANLASIHSSEEDTFIVNLIKEATGEYRRTWIGAQDAVQEGLWMWSDGSVWGYSNWRQTTGEPNNKDGIEHFAVINWGDALWNDLPGNLTLDYCCAKDAQMSVSLTLGDLQYKCSPNMK